MEEVKEFIAYLVMFVVIPLIPCIALWFFLAPVTFWEKLFFLIAAIFVYGLTIGVEFLIFLILD